LRRKKREERGELGIQSLQPWGSHPKHENELPNMMNQRGTHLYKRWKVQVLIPYKIYKKREGKEEERGAAALAHEIISLMTQKHTLEGSHLLYLTPKAHVQFYTFAPLLDFD
jgi:hypothetical protein